MTVYLLILGAIALVGTFAAITLVTAKKRREAFTSLTAKHGWGYTERNDAVLDMWHGDIFDNGHNRQARNIVAGVHDGREFVAFDYRYYTTETRTDSKGNTSRYEKAHNYGVLALDTDHSYPGLDVRPEGAIGRVFGRLTNSDITFESEEFNRAFTVNCEDRKFASDVLNPQMMEFLVAHPDLTWKFHHQYLLSARTGQITVEDIEPTLVIFDTLLDSIPDFVSNDPAYTEHDYPRLSFGAVIGDLFTQVRNHKNNPNTPIVPLTERQ